MGSVRAIVADLDPDLVGTLPAVKLEPARSASVAAVITVQPGEWDTHAEADQARGGYGLLVLDGLLVRRVGFDGRFGAELLGAGRPAAPMGERRRGGRHAAVRDDLAGDGRDARGGARPGLGLADGGYPQVGGCLTGRALARSQRLATSMAIVQLPRLDDRLWMLFWELADRYGRVHPDGVHLDLPLTHELLSHLAAARRPSVSGALTRLAEQGRLIRSGRAWVLTGEPPENGFADGQADIVVAPG